MANKESANVGGACIKTVPAPTADALREEIARLVSERDRLAKEVALLGASGHEVAALTLIGPQAFGAGTRPGGTTLGLISTMAPITVQEVFTATRNPELIRIERVR